MSLCNHWQVSTHPRVLTEGKSHFWERGTVTGAVSRPRGLLSSWLGDQLRILRSTGALWGAFLAHRASLLGFCCGLLFCSVSWTAKGEGVNPAHLIWANSSHKNKDYLYPSGTIQYNIRRATSGPHLGAGSWWDDSACVCTFSAQILEYGPSSLLSDLGDPLLLLCGSSNLVQGLGPQTEWARRKSALVKYVFIFLKNPCKFYPSSKIWFKRKICLDHLAVKWLNILLTNLSVKCTELEDDACIS